MQSCQLPSIRETAPVALLRPNRCVLPTKDIFGRRLSLQLMSIYWYSNFAQQWRMQTNSQQVFQVVRLPGQGSLSAREPVPLSPPQSQYTTFSYPLACLLSTKFLHASAQSAKTCRCVEGIRTGHPLRIECRGRCFFYMSTIRMTNSRNEA